MKTNYLSQIFRIIVVTLLIVTAANAQWGHRRRPHRGMKSRMEPTSYVGIRVGQDFQHEQLLAGGQFWLPVSRFWRLVPNFDYYFGKSMTRWQFNGDIVFQPKPFSPLYIGGGIAVDYSKPTEGEFQSSIGGNALLGLNFGSRRLRSFVPYLQARWSIYENDSFFSLIGGINFALK